MKKILLCILSMVLTMQLVGEVFQIKNVYALENEEILGEKVSFYIEETPVKRICTAVMENGQEYTCEYIKTTGKAYMNDHEMDYSFTTNTDVLKEDAVVNDTIVDLYAVNPWTPITILENQHIDFAPLINGAGTVAALATQFYTAMIGCTASSLIQKLAKATLKKHWSYIADFCGESLLGLIGSNASKIVNVTFSYDMQMTSGLVDLMGSGVKVTAYRYANYTGIIKLLGHTFSKGTGEYGGWWSSTKPYGLDRPIEEY